MREIKFRGKTKDGEWVYGYIDATAYKDLVVIHSEATTYEVLPETVGQYTGLEDVNGKDIYEGDIIRVEEYWNELMDIEHEEDDFDVFSLEEIKGKKRKEFVSPVIWEDGVFSVYDSEDSGYFLCILAGDMRRSQPIFISTIIGNVYDNPELL